MRMIKGLGGTLVALLLVAGCAGKDQSMSGPNGQMISAELERAVTVAASAAKQEGHSLAEYTLTSAQRIFFKGNYIWRITFKPNRLLPADPSKDPKGAGGEIFVNVDLVRQEAVVRYGE